MKYINYNKGALIPNRPKISLPKKKEDLNNMSSNINSPGRAHLVYKTKPPENDEKNTETNTHINHNNSLASITKRIRKKYYKNNPKNKIAIKKNNNILKNINIRKASPNNKSKAIIDKIDNDKNKVNDGQKELNTNKNTNINTNINNSIINNKKDIIQLEDLLILEGKLCHLMDCLKYENPMPKMCIEWWNFYTYSSYFGKFPKLFPKTKDEDRDRNNYIISDYQIAHDSMMFELLSMIISYQILNDPKLNQNLINSLKNLINEVHQNFLIECDYILSKVNNQSLNNLWIKKLKNLILAKRNWSDNNSDKKNFHLDLIKQGNNIIQNLIQYLLSTYTRANSNNIDINSLTHFNKNISDIKLMELSGYYNRVISQENMKINKKFSYIIKKKSNDDKYVSIIVPYLPEEIEGKKKFTLVLDLDETLISFRIDEHHRGMVKMRPGLYKFLKNVGSKYELIIFTAGTQEYADPILDVIEKNEKFFAKRLYRQHTIFMNNTYIKDLTRLGRDLSKTIIVDNMPQNFCLQRENGIFIKNFFGEDKNDTALNDLTHILLKIASNPNNDVRAELKKYKEEIFTKITTNLNN
jgi:Dullard-like phosphatase family protein